MFRSVLLSALALLAVNARVSADFINYSLTVPNSALAPFPGPYATVNVNRTDTTHATITFTATPQGGFIYRFGDGQSIDVNVGATSWSVSNLMITDPLSTGSLSDQGGGNVDGFGIMNQRFDNTNGGTNPFLSASFTLTDLSGTWANAGQVLQANSDGLLAAAHVFVYTSPTDTGAFATGFAANGGFTPPPPPPPPNVPEPATVVTLATAVPMGLFALWRRRSTAKLLPV